MSSMADLQRAPGAPPPPVPAALPLAVERVRTFDTPEFAGMTFLEVEAKTALNRVKGMPFGWSINPYRGCSHACSYCLRGETPILMADGRTKPLADVRIGDAIYGTVPWRGQRRYVITRVLDHWSTVRPASRVVLEDGTKLIASGDHRFLSRQGWRRVTRLTISDRLVGTGRFADPPKQTEEYRRGYLRGMIGADGHLDLADPDARARTCDYLGDHGAVTTAELIGWPAAAPPDDWCKGFLAGIFDACGDAGEGMLAIRADDPATVEQLTRCLRRLGFGFAVESGPDDGATVRIQGGLEAHLRFFHLTHPAITRKRSIEGRPVPAGTSSRVVAVEPLGLDLPLFDITTGTGDFIADGVVSHNCFARPSHAYLNLSPLGDFERTIVVKTNIPEVLRRELARPTWRGEHVAMGTNTDNYQRAEGRYRLMPGIIAALTEALTPFSILTKGTLITRDIALLQAAAERMRVTAALTIGMLDERVWRDAEPGTPSPVARLAAVRRLNEAGIPTGVMLAPIMPGLNDDREQLSALVDAAVRAQATQITPIVLHLRPGVREAFWPWLTEHHPELVGRYGAMYRGSQAPASYRDEIQAFVKAERAAAWKRHGGADVPPEPRWRQPEEPEAAGAPADYPVGAAGHQLSLL